MESRDSPSANGWQWQWRGRYGPRTVAPAMTTSWETSLVMLSFTQIEPCKMFKTSNNIDWIIITYECYDKLENNVNSKIHQTIFMILIFSPFGTICQGTAILLVWGTRSSILYHCLVMQPGLLVSGSIVQRIYLGKVKSYWLHFLSSWWYETQFETWP